MPGPSAPRARRVPPPLPEIVPRVIALRTELCRLLVAVEDRRERERPELLRRYRGQVGPSAQSSAAAELRLDRARRVWRLLSERRDAGLRVTRVAQGEIERKVDNELVDRRELLHADAQALDAVGRLPAQSPPRREVLTAAATAYRRLVLRLHPELHGAVSSRQRHLLTRARAAYAALDVDELRTLELLIVDGEQALTVDAPVTAWAVEETRLRACLSGYLDRLAAMDDEWPFSIRAKLDEPSWIAEQCASHWSEAHAWTDEAASIEAEIASLVRAEAGRGRGTPLLRCLLAGTSHRGSPQLFEALAIDEELTLVRETSNEHDALAIQVRGQEDTLFGYIPRGENAVLAALLDGGMTLRARVATKRLQGTWWRVVLEVTLVED